jgi:hypothetical protein
LILQSSEKTLNFNLLKSRGLKGCGAVLYSVTKPTLNNPMATSDIPTKSASQQNFAKASGMSRTQRRRMRRNEVKSILSAAATAQQLVVSSSQSPPSSKKNPKCNGNLEGNVSAKSKRGYEYVTINVTL